MEVDEQHRRCAGPCGEVKHNRMFYKKHDVCRACIFAPIRDDVREKKLATLGVPLATKVEAHRQEKILREELKKLARERMKKKRAARRVAARKTLIPQVEEGEVKVDAATKELARRTLARRRLVEFIQEFHPRYMAGWVHHDICMRLEKFAQDVADGKSPRLMILMPPRHGKSQIASKMFPAWTLGHWNHFEVIACSYNVSLALEFSREVRDVVRSERYGVLFPDTKINQEAQGAEAWKLMSPTGVGAGGYVAAGIGGPITGKGAHILIIDDPIKNAEEAESPDIRKKIWDWYGSTAYTRLAPGGGVLVIQTCWHDDDLAGRLQAMMKEDPEADQFEVVKYPAVAIEDERYRSEGEALHPERYDMDALMRIKRTIGLRYWGALYQQDPAPDEGSMFTKEMFVHRGDAVRWQGMHVYQAWDFAIRTKQSNDWTVGATGGHDPDDMVHILDVDRFKTSDAGEICDRILDNFEKFGGHASVRAIGVEEGQIWFAMQTTLQDRMRLRRIYPPFVPLKALREKEVRARPLQGRMQALRVTFPRAAPWLENAMKELLRFPAGVHDDVVDALAWLITLISGKAPPKRTQSGERSREKTLAQKLKGLGKIPGKSHMAA